MAFCNKCGANQADGARFCVQCGGAMAVMSSPVQESQTLEYTIHGDNLQVARVKLKPGQELYAEAGKMVYKTPSVQWETRMTGNSLGEKIWGAVKRKLSGESLFMTHFRADAPGEVGFAPRAPRPAPGARDGFLAAQPTVQLNIALVKKLGAGFFGGEGFILQKLTGPGIVFIHGGGDFIEFQLAPGEQLQVDTGCIVAFEEAVQYDIQFVGGIKTAIFGGEGLFLATLTGPGRVIIQSMTLDKMRRELAPSATGGGDERSGLGAITGLFNSDD